MQTKSKWIMIAGSVIGVGAMAIGIVVPMVLIKEAYVNNFVGNSQMRLSGSYGPVTTLEYDKIASIYSSANFDVGIRTNGFADKDYLLGHFKNDSLGKYINYVYRDVDTVIIVQDDQKNYYVFNMPSLKQTSSSFELINSNLN